MALGGLVATLDRRFRRPRKTSQKENEIGANLNQKNA